MRGHSGVITFKDDEPYNIQPALNWRSPCCGFTYLAVPDDRTKSALFRLQEKIIASEPALLATPRYSLHVTILSLLKVRRFYSDDKHRIWDRHGATWASTISRSPHRLRLASARYTSLRVTNSAIIALLQPSGEVNAYRHDLLEALGIVGAEPPLRLLHTTLFRFQRSPRHPARLRRLLAAENVEIPLRISAAVISHEMVYPHLEFQILLRWPIDRAAGHPWHGLLPPSVHPSPVR